MAQSVQPAGYSPLQKILHWLVALIVLMMAPIGLYMVWRGGATNFDALTNQLYSMHKLIGFTLLWLVLFRLVVRARRGVPAPESTLQPLQVFVSEAVHKLLYLMLFAVPMLGWAGVSAYGATDIFGLFSLPSILPKDTALAEKILKVHGFAALGLMALIAMHFGAALFHRFILKDGVMKRMLP